MDALRAAKVLAQHPDVIWGEENMFGRETGATGRSAHAQATALAELLERCADFAERNGRTELSADILRLAKAVREQEADALAGTDTLFAWDGPLHMASVVDGWDEEYLGLAAAYRVESAGLR